MLRRTGCAHDLVTNAFGNGEATLVSSNVERRCRRGCLMHCIGRVTVVHSHGPTHHWKKNQSLVTIPPMTWGWVSHLAYTSSVWRASTYKAMTSTSKFLGHGRLG
eukprot:2358387-Amphidinium_carterae.2